MQWIWPALAAMDQEPVEIVPEDFARLPDKVQPPKHWIDAHGRTESCSSCATRHTPRSAMSAIGIWIRSQRTGEAVQWRKLKLEFSLGLFH